MLAPWQEQQKHWTGDETVSSNTVTTTSQADHNISEADSEPAQSTIAKAADRSGGRRRSSITFTNSGTFKVDADIPESALDSPLIVLLGKAADPDFDIELLEPHTNAQPLLCVVVYFCNFYCLVETLELSMATFQAYLVGVESAYRPLPYHSALHGADVVTSVIRLLKQSTHSVTLTPLELFAFIVGAAGQIILQLLLEWLLDSVRS